MWPLKWLYRFWGTPCARFDYDGFLPVARLKYTQTSETLEDDNNNEPRKNINLDYISFRLGSDRLQNYFSTKRYNGLLIANCDLFKTEYSEVTLNNDLNAENRGNGSPSKNPDIKTPLVMSFSLGVIIHFSPLAAFWWQGSFYDSHYLSQTYSESDIL